MTLRIQSLAFDCANPLKLAQFWAEVLGGTVKVDEEDAYIEFDGMTTGDLLFLPVPEGKVVKNRLHLDLRPDDQAAEVARLEDLGARRVSVGQGDDVTWVVMADPEGNEFCVLRARN